MTRVAVVGDTHCYHDPGGTVPDWVRRRVSAADTVVHTGDFVTPDARAFFDECAAELVAVRGNGDVAGVDLPRVAAVTIEDVTIGVTHPPGVGDVDPAAEGYGRTVVETIEDRHGPVDVAIAGHTHRVLDRVVSGTRLLNPGSATGALPARTATMLVLDLEAGNVTVRTYDRDGARDG